jgi:MFS family permease
MTSAGPVKRNAPLLAASAGLRFALFPIPVITLFWKDQIGMSLTEIMWLQSIFGATAVVCEFPSGYVADRLGYRRSLVVGACFWLAGWIAYALGATFAGIALAEILLGVGLAFISGADSALLYVSVEGGESSDRYRAWEGRVRATSQASEAASAAVGGWLYSIAPRLPFWLQIPVAAANLGAIAALYDVRPLEGATRTSHLRRAWHIVAHALVRHARLRASMTLSVALGISTYIAVWLIQPWMQRRGIAPAWFGLLWAAAHLWLAAVSLVNARVAQMLGVAPVLLGCSVLAGASYLALALGSSALAVVFYLGFMTVRGLQGPLLAGALQADAPPEDRASVLSLNALLFRLTSAIVLPSVGALADRIGIEPTLGVLAALSLAVCLAAWSAFARAHRS